MLTEGSRSFHTAHTDPHQRHKIQRQAEQSCFRVRYVVPKLFHVSRMEMRRLLGSSVFKRVPCGQIELLKAQVMENIEWIKILCKTWRSEQVRSRDTSRAVMSRTHLLCRKACRLSQKDCNTSNCWYSYIYLTCETEVMTMPGLEIEAIQSSLLPTYC